jgi:CRISPR system Cascade subunit CasE
MWRLEPETNSIGSPRILVQSQVLPKWTRIGIKRWLLHADPPIDLWKQLNLDFIGKGQRFRLRLKTNPCVKRNGKRIGLLRTDEQEDWIERKGLHHGFALPELTRLDFLESDQKRIDVWISQDQMLRGRQYSGNTICIFSAMFDGILTVTESNAFKEAIKTGIGHGKVKGLGLLSVVPI